jgi:stage V sporulation protein D (sporulation-specific penicillin-binding protein)
VLDQDGNVVEETERTVLRQVISEETSQTMCQLLESVVAEGTAKNAQIAGYRIGGKTGTSEKIDVYDEDGNPVEDKIVSFVGIAPMDDPQYIVLVALDTPAADTGYYISGGQMAAPTVREVLADMLPYLGIYPDYDQDTLAEETVPDLTDLTSKEAKAALQDTTLTFRTVGSGDTVTDQVPEAGAVIPGGSEIVLYFGEESPGDTILVPDVTGKDPETANQLLSEQGLYMKIIGAASGDGTIAATSQSPEGGTEVSPGTVVQVEFSDLGARD